MGEFILFLLIVMFILMLLQGIFGLFGSLFGAIGEFLFNTYEGFIAILFLGMAAIFFYASSKTFNQALEKGRVINTIKPMLQAMEKAFNNSKLSITDMKKSLIHTFATKETVIDLSRINLQTMVRKLALAINKPNPVFFKGWGNQRLQLDVERMYIIKDYIEAIRSAGESFINLQADAILSYEKIEKLVQINRNVLLRQLKESELQIDLLKVEYQTTVDRLKLDIANLEALLYEKIAQIENLEARTKEIIGDLENRTRAVDAEIRRNREESESNIRISEAESRARIKLNEDKSQAEIYVLKLKARDTSRISKQRAMVLDKIIDEMKIDNIRPIEVYLLIQLLETNSVTDFVDFDNKIKIMNEQLEKMKIENKKGSAEAREADAKADEIVAQAKQNIKDLYNNDRR